MLRIHVGDILQIDGNGFGDVQGNKWVKVDGVEAEVISWSDSSVSIYIPEPTIITNEYVAVSFGNSFSEYIFPDELWILLGGILRFVNPDNWEEVLLDLDNGGDGSSQQIWQQQGTEIPPPNSEATYTAPDSIDGEELILSRLPNKEALLTLLLTGDTKDDLDTVVHNLIVELYKDTGCLEYRPERASKSMFYTVYRVVEKPEMADYFTHKERVENYAYDVSVKLPCHPWAEGEEEEVIASNNLIGNGGFEQGLVGWNKTETGTGSPSVTIDSANYMPGGSKSCQLLTGDAGDVAGITKADFVAVDSSKTHNIQVFGFKQVTNPVGSIKVTATIFCYDEYGVATSPASIEVLTDISPSGAAWEDMVTINGSPVIYPEGSTQSPVWPENTTQVKVDINQSGAVGTVSIDGVLLTESEYISDNLLEAALGITIPKGVFKGHIAAPMNICISNAQDVGPWSVQNTGVSSNLYGINYPSSTKAIAVGAGGKILFNNGSSWVPKTSGTISDLFAIHYLDATHFWAAGSNGVVLFSTDGTTWSAQAYPMADLSMADPSFEGSLSTYWTTWSNNNTVGFIRTPQQHKWGSHSLSVLMTVGFHQAVNAYCAAKSTNYSSVINVKNTYTIGIYQRTSSLPTPIPGITRQIQVKFYNSAGALLGTKTGVAFGNSTLNVWTFRTLVITPSDYPVGTHKIAVGIRYGGAPTSIFYLTMSEYWDAISIEHTGNPTLYGIHAVAANNAVAVGQLGVIVKWNGSVWLEKVSGITTNLNAVTAVDSSHWIAVGNNGKILISSDGNTWTQATSYTTQNLYGVTALSDGKVWAVGANGAILFSDNNGATWSVQISSTTKTLYSVFAFDTTHIWACGEGGTLLSSNFSQISPGIYKHWAIEGTGITTTLRSISTYDATHALVVGESGVALAGINTASVLPITNLAAGQSKEVVVSDYGSGFNPVLDAVSGSLVVNAAGQYRRRSRYRAMAGGDTEEFLFNVSKHKGTFLISISGGINNAVNYDQIVITMQLKNASGVAINPTVVPTNPASLDLSTASGYTTVGYFREVVMLASKFAEVSIPPTLISSLAKQANIDVSFLLTAPSGMGGGDRLNIDCLSLIPTDESFVILSNWGTGASGAQQAYMILNSIDGFVMSSTSDSEESATVYPSIYTHGSPQFKAKPSGVNIALIASCVTGTGATLDYQMNPRLNIKFRYHPRYLLTAVKPKAPTP